jgi:hypothetical protein
MESMVHFHQDVLFIMFLISILITWFLIRIHLFCSILSFKYSNPYLGITEYTKLKKSDYSIFFFLIKFQEFF